MMLDNDVISLKILVNKAPSGDDIYEELMLVLMLLLKKNISYGDSALNPIGVFSSGTAVEQIQVRIDDKLNRIMNQEGFEDEDTIQDLIGYLILYKIARDRDGTN